MQTQTNKSQIPQTRDPFRTLFSRLFSDPLQEFYETQDAAATPRINISETELAYELAFELPGLDEKEIQVNLQDHVLTVTGERKEDRETQGKRWHRVEHRYGKFTRAVSLPNDAAGNGVQAVYRQGVLTVSVPKVPESRPTRIEVRSK